MKDIFYFNVNYKCNNMCRFCFSHNVGSERGEMTLSSIENVLNMCSENDLVVINGGEPSLHEQLNEIIESILSRNLYCNVYTNGRRLSEFNFRQDSIERLRFIIPIHGDREIHDYITQVDGSYDETLKSLKYINGKYTYNIKFIVNKEMIYKNFNVYNFLTNNDLKPDEVVLARLNRTRKSKINKYEIPNHSDEKEYIKRCMNELHQFYNICILDYPMCFIEKKWQRKINQNELKKYGQFVYSDDKICAKKRKYLKQKLVFPECYKCDYIKLCNYLSESYDVIKLKKKTSELVLELE